MTELISAASTENGVVQDLAFRAAVPRSVPDDVDLATYVDADGQAQVLDFEAYRSQPRRKHGAVGVVDVDSFQAYIGRHGEADGVEIWANPPTPKGGGASIVAVLNGHTQEATGWGDHRAVLAFRRDLDWDAWVSYDGKWLTQDDFAEFLTQHAVNVLRPDGATVLELVQAIQAKKSVVYESQRRIANGETQLVYKETIDARAGQGGTLEVPEDLTLALRPFEGAPAVQLAARFRYRIEGQSLRLGYVLTRPDEAARAAFDAVVEEVNAFAEDHEWPVFTGTPLPLR